MRFATTRPCCPDTLPSGNLREGKDPSLTCPPGFLGVPGCFRAGGNRQRAPRRLHPAASGRCGEANACPMVEDRTALTGKGCRQRACPRTGSMGPRSLGWRFFVPTGQALLPAAENSRREARLRESLWGTIGSLRVSCRPFGDGESPFKRGDRLFPDEADKPRSVDPNSSVDLPQTLSSAFFSRQVRLCRPASPGCERVRRTPESLRGRRESVFPGRRPGTGAQGPSVLQDFREGSPQRDPDSRKPVSSGKRTGQWENGLRPLLKRILCRSFPGKRVGEQKDPLPGSWPFQRGKAG